jgi:hypothetical protein
MEKLLTDASPDQLLLCMAAPIGGAIVFGLILFFAFAGRLRKQDTAKKSAMANKTADPLDLWSALPTSNFVQSDSNHRALGGQPDPLTTTSDLVYPSKMAQAPDRVPPEEPLMFNSFKSPQNDKIDLAARLGMVAAVEPTQPNQQITQIPGQMNQAAAIAPAADSVELLRLLRDGQSGQLILEIAGRRYTKLADITDKDIGQYILKLVAHLLVFTNGMIATDAGVKSLPAPKMGQVPLPPVAVTPQPQVVAPVAPKPSVDVEAAFLASLMQPPKPAEPQPQRRGLLGRAKPAKTEEVLLPPLNLAEQINRIAQARLLASSLGRNTKLEITSDLYGGIRINVNGTFYESPDDVPNLEIRDLIKESIRQWEKSL